MTRSVMLLGATGLVGGECLRLLANDPTFGPVAVLTRRPLPPELPRPATHPKIDERVVDFEGLAEATPATAEDPVPRVDVVICALGTTLRRAGSKERFRQVDFGYPLALARRALEGGAGHFLLVSSVGASSRSRFFYSRVKGELEDAVAALGYRRLTIVRPSLLLGHRAELRPGEEIARRLAFLAVLLPPRYRPVHAAHVAATLVRAASDDTPGQRIIESAAIAPDA